MKTTSRKIRTSFISAAALLFAVPFTAQAGNFSEIAAEVLDATCEYGDTVVCDYKIRINDDPDLSHLNLELPEGADVIAPADVTVGKDGSVKGTEYADTVYVKWDQGQKKDTTKTYTVEFDNVPEGAGDGWTCEMGFKAAQLYTVTEVPGPCRPGPEEEAAGLDVEFSEPLQPIDKLTPQVCTDELKRQPLVAGQNTDVGFVCARVEDQDGNGDADTLVVTYETDNGWNLKETHLWVENNEDPVLPANKKGNPKIGNFPHVTEGLYETVNEVEIPLENFGDLHSLLCDGNGMSLELNADLAAHASVLHEDLGQETAWAAGDQIVAKGSWAMKTELKFTCK
ncbi:MAG: hypothetical protein D3911_13580 [Candidatus Electrothrix sp. AW3_4]|nr:hypothetical protein [Candidatus Electrothrix gigas]